MLKWRRNHINQSTDQRVRSQRPEQLLKQLRQSRLNSPNLVAASNKYTSQKANTLLNLLTMFIRKAIKIHKK